MKQFYQIDSLGNEAGINSSDSVQKSDSILIVDSLGKTNQKTIISVLANNKFGAEKIEPKTNFLLNQDWITIHILIILMVVAWANTFYRKRVKQVFNAFFSTRNQTFMVRDGNLFRERISIALLIVFLFSISLFIYLFSTELLHLKIFDLSGFKYFSFLFLAVLLTWVLKNLAITFIGITFKNSLILEEFLLTNFIFNIVSGVFLLPFIVVAVYFPSVIIIKIGLYFLIIVFIYRMFRQLLLNSGGIKFSWYNRILYLCTFEIIPILIIIKLVMSNLN
ncbi:MAG: DUF4271 domain-containing protein [Bacteroidales bacterium]